MTSVTLVGIDPGVIDTGLVVISLNSQARTWQVRHKAYNRIARNVGQVVEFDLQALMDIVYYVDEELKASSLVLIGVEGYRQRGKNQRQDQLMLALVQKLNNQLFGSQIVDNTGMKNVVTDATLRLFQVSRFPATNHADLKSAARVALKMGIMLDAVNPLIADFIWDNTEGNEPWTLASTSVS